MNTINSSDTTVQQLALTVKVIGSQILAEYTCLPGNLPATNHNWIGIWEGSQIPRDSAPLSYGMVATNNPTNSLTVYESRETNTQYIVGYGTGCVSKSEPPAKVDTPEKKAEPTTRVDLAPAPGTVGATVQVNVDGSLGDISLTQVSILAVGNNTMILSYSTPTFNVPQDNENWIGIWPGSTVAFDGKNRLYKTKVESLFNTGQLCIPDFSFTIGTTYTIAYATGPSDSDIAATVTFTTQGYGQ